MKYWKNDKATGVFSKDIREITAVYEPITPRPKIIRIDKGCSCGGKLIPTIVMEEDGTLKATFTLKSTSRLVDTKYIIVYYITGEKDFLQFSYKYE